MRTYKLFDAFGVINSHFSFLVEDWKFKKVREENINYGCYFEYKKHNLILYIGYEYMDNCFYFEFKLNEERTLFMSFFEEREPNLEWRLFQPDDFQYKESLMRNVEYLKKYKDDVLKLVEDKHN